MTRIEKKNKLSCRQLVRHFKTISKRKQNQKKDSNCLVVTFVKAVDDGPEIIKT
jgi:hypothetical protein